LSISCCLCLSPSSIKTKVGNFLYPASAAILASDWKNKRWAQGDWNARPSQYKYGNLMLTVGFSDFIGLSSSRFLEEDTTTRKASAHRAPFDRFVLTALQAL
jgi:hypothetical protein